MANYYASARSNYFRVKNPGDFEDWCKSFENINFKRCDQENMYMIYVEDSDGAGWPCTRYDEENNIDEDVDLEQELFTFLFEGQVAILEEVGNEKLRYLHGSSIAVNHLGDTIYVNLNDIYKKVSEEWPDSETPTEATY